jgi:hypothetical protein
MKVKAPEILSSAVENYLGYSLSISLFQPAPPLRIGVGKFCLANLC